MYVNNEGNDKMTDQGLIAIEQMVQREVLCCMSSLVSTLAQNEDSVVTRSTRRKESQNCLADLCEQASELAAPVLDYEEAATQNGFYLHPEWNTWVARSEDNSERKDREEYLGADQWGRAYDIDPYEWEVYEHWAVSQWLADKLIAQGERVDTDFAGLYIWARTTTGQSITMDGCIQRIYADMMAPYTLDSVAPGA